MGDQSPELGPLSYQAVRALADLIIGDFENPADSFVVGLRFSEILAEANDPDAALSQIMDIWAEWLTAQDQIGIGAPYDQAAEAEKTLAAAPLAKLPEEEPGPDPDPANISLSLMVGSMALTFGGEAVFYTGKTIAEVGTALSRPAEASPDLTPNAIKGSLGMMAAIALGGLARRLWHR